MATETRTFLTHSLSNGLTLIAEPMPAVRSAAFCLLMASGSGYDPDGRQGTAYMTADLVMRGAGPRDTRQLVDDLDRLGVTRSVTVETEFTSFSGSTLGANLSETLAIYADILQRPHLPEAELEPIRQAVIQELQAQEEDPRNKLFTELRQQHWPTPFNHPPMGTLQTVPWVTYDDARSHWEKWYTPNGGVLTVAGHFDWDDLRRTVDQLFGGWTGQEPSPPTPGPRGERVSHLNQDTAQTHIGVCCDAVPYRDDEFLAIRAALAVLSDGSSSRLFTELREKRGLCYAVSAQHTGFRDFGGVACYVGTTPDKADDALELLVAELDRLSEGIEPRELERAKIGLRSGLIISLESTSSRAGFLARDWFYLGRVRSVDEIEQAIEQLTVDDLLEHLRRHPFTNHTVVTIGPKQPRLPELLRGRA